MADTWQSRMGTVEVEAEPTPDRARAIALLRVQNHTVEKMNLSKGKDQRAFAVEMLMLGIIANELRKIPPDVYKAAQEQVKKDDVSPQLKANKPPAPSVPEDINFKTLQAALNHSLEAKTPEEALDRLITFQDLGAQWVTKDQSSDNPLDIQRIAAIREFTDWAIEQSQELNKAMAGDAYLKDIRGEATHGTEFQALTSKSAKEVQRRVVGRGTQGGLSEALRAAILIFTGPDYGYINPATMVDHAWLQSNKANAYTAQAFEGARGEHDDGQQEDAHVRARMDVETRMKEGAAHAGMMMETLKRLPVYKGTVYRGFTYTRKVSRTL